jgi:hypothetical protein
VEKRFRARSGNGGAHGHVFLRGLSLAKSQKSALGPVGWFSEMSGQGRSPGRASLARRGAADEGKPPPGFPTQAAGRAASAGWRTGFHFDPLIPCPV